MFIDEAEIELFGGRGGNGCAGMRREKFEPHGGPDGGDGGDGGSVYLQAVEGVDTLLDMVSKHHWHAGHGDHGSGKKKDGRRGEDLTIRLPPGTLVYDCTTGLLVADLTPAGRKVLIAAGGKGGRGNVHFMNSVRQAPDFAEPGKPGHSRRVKLQLRLIADVGLIGMPNAGKSTLLSRLSAARPKIADYPFTTLKPKLGIAELDADRRLVMADIPGLIEGAHAGAGLGQDFLRHIERTRVLIHLVDILPLDGKKPIEAYLAIREELFRYSPRLAGKPEILIANKMDLTGAAEALDELRYGLPGKHILAVSAATGTGLRPLLELVWQLVQRSPKSEAFVERPPVILPVESSDGGGKGHAIDETHHVTGKDAAESADVSADDAQLAAEVAAMKADDIRKGKYYKKAKPKSD